MAENTEIDLSQYDDSDIFTPQTPAQPADTAQYDDSDILGGSLADASPAIDDFELPDLPLEETESEPGFFDNTLSLAAHGYDQAKANIAALYATTNWDDMDDDQRNAFAEVLAAANKAFEKPEELEQYYQTIGDEAQDVGDAWEKGDYLTAGLQALDFLGSALVESVTNPKGFVYANAEQAANMAVTWIPGIAGGKAGAAAGAPLGPAGAAVGGGAGFVLGAGTGEFIVETGGQIRDFIAKKGGNPLDPDQIAQTLADPAFRRQMLEKASKKGLSIAAFDAVANLAAMKLLSPKLVKGKDGKYLRDEKGRLLKEKRGAKSTLKRGLAAEAAQIGAAGGGEAVGQTAATGEIDWRDLGLEVALEMGPGGIADIALSTNAARAKNTAEDTGKPEQDAAQGDNAEDVIGSVEGEETPDTAEQEPPSEEIAGEGLQPMDTREVDEMGLGKPERGTRGAEPLYFGGVEYQDTDIDALINEAAEQKLSLVPKDKQGAIEDNSIDFEYVDMDTGEKKTPETTKDWFDAAHQIDFEEPKDERSIEDLIQSPKPRDVRRGLSQLRKQHKELSRKPDDAIRLIARAGGISRESAKEHGFDPQDMKKAQSGVFSRPLFPKEGGLTFDDIGEILWEAGYQSKEYPGERMTQNEAMEIVRDSLITGKKYYSPEEEVAVADSDARLEQVEALIEKAEARINELKDYKELTEKYGEDVADYVYGKRRLQEIHDEEARLYSDKDLYSVYADEEGQDAVDYSTVTPEDITLDDDAQSLSDLIERAQEVVGEDPVVAIVERMAIQDAPNAEIAKALYTLIETSGGQNETENTQAEQKRADGAVQSQVETPAKDTEKPEQKLIDEAANEAATSPKNNKPEPSPQQKEAENYKTGDIPNDLINGLDVKIENPKDSYRFKIDMDKLKALAKRYAGVASAVEDLKDSAKIASAFKKLEALSKSITALKPILEQGWYNQMKSHYGKFVGTKGADGDPVDVFLGPNASDETLPVFIIDQENPKNRRFDEHKVMVGYQNEAEARQAYLENYEEGWDGLGAITEVSLDQLKDWLKNGDTTKRYRKKGLKKKAKQEKPQETRQVEAETPETEAPDFAYLKDKEGRQALKKRGYDPNSSMGHGYMRGWRDAKAGNYDVDSIHPAQQRAYDEAFSDFENAAEKPPKKRSFRKERRAEGANRKERRQNAAKRKEIEEMSPDEMRAEIERLRAERLTSRLTGLPNQTAFEEDAGKGLDVIVAMDMDGLGWHNDNWGHDVTDDILRQVGEKLATFARDDFRIYHRSGDEFAIRTDSKEKAKELAEQLQNEMDNGTVFVITERNVDGKKVKVEYTKSSIGFSIGIGDSYEEADQKSYENKAEREASGKRSPKGTQPPGVSERIIEEGRDNQESGNQVAGDLFGEDVSKEQVVADEKRRIDEKLSGKEDVPMSAGEGDLFSDADKQVDIEDVTGKPERQESQETESNLAKAARIIAKAGGVMNLAGKANADARQQVMSLLKGEKVSKAKSGVNNIKSVLKSVIGFAGGTAYDEEKAINQWAKETAGNSKPAKRFEAGKALSSEERKEVLRGVTDVYVENGVQKVEKGVDSRGETIYGYPHSPEYFVKSDITGRMLRYYITLPDGRIAHPTELYPEIEQSSIDKEMLRREQEQKQEEAIKADYLRNAEKYMDESLAKASRKWRLGQNADTDTKSEVLYSEKENKYLRVHAGEIADRYLEVLKGRGFKRIPDPAILSEPGKSSEYSPVSPEDYHKERVIKAFAHISRSPENAAKVFTDDFVRTVQDVYDENLKLAETDAQKQALREAIEQFKKDYMKAELPELRARENTVSGHIAGRSNFNSSRADKQNDAILKAGEKKTKAIRKLKADVREAVINARTPEQVERDAKQAAEDSANKEFNDKIKVIAGALGAMSDPGMDKAAFRPKATRALKEALEMDKEKTLEQLAKIDSYLADDGGIKKVAGARSEFWKVYSAALEGGNNEQIGEADAESNQEARVFHNKNGEKSYTGDVHNDLIESALDNFGFLIPRNKSITAGEFADTIEDYSSDPRAKEVVGALRGISDKPASKAETANRGDTIEAELGGRTYKERVLQVLSNGEIVVDIFGEKKLKPGEYRIIKRKGENPEAKQEPAKPEAPQPEKPDLENYSLKTHQQVIDRLNAGDLTVEEFQAAFNALMKRKDAIIEELSVFTKDKLLDRLDIYKASRLKSARKAEVVDRVYDAMLNDFNLDGTLSFFPGKVAYEKALSEKVKSYDQEAIDRYAADLKRAHEEMEQARQEIREGIENPQTEDDFRRYIGVKMKEDGLTFSQARMTLSPEQRARFDEMVALREREERGQRGQRTASSVSVASETTGAKLVETQHTRDGYDLFVVVPDNRVSKDDYRTWLATAKKMGGWYSRYRGNGATPGFQFKDKESAEAFMAYITGGDTGAVKDRIQDRRDAFADDKSQSAVERLREMADRLEEKANEKLNADRKTNTARRASMAARAEAQAQADIALAKTMRNIADAIESGKAKLLDAVRTKAQVEMLQQIVYSAHHKQVRDKVDGGYEDVQRAMQEPPDAETADYVEFPYYTAFRSDLATLGRQLLEIPGLKKLGKRILKVADDVTNEYLKFAKANLDKVATFVKKDGERAVFKSKADAQASIEKSGYKGKAVVLPFKRGQNIIIISPSEARKEGIWEGDDDKRITLYKEDVEGLIGKARKTTGVDVPWQFESMYEKRKRLESMNIETPAELRAAIREFINLREEQAKPDKIKELERKMVGRQNDGLDFFPTPTETADEMVDVAGVEPGMAVLEPSAGMGHIAERIREAGVEPDVVEASADRRELLEAKGFNVVGDDFLALKEREGMTYGDVFKDKDGNVGIMKGHPQNAYGRVMLESEDGEFIGYYDFDELIPVEKRGYGSGYDRIIMNPPFSKGRDVEHVKHAYSLLKPGGRLVALMGEHSFFAKDKKSQEFREWLESVGGSDEKLPEGTFQDPSLPVNTGVNARMVVIEKEKPVFSRYSLEQNKPVGKGISKQTAEKAIDDFKKQHNGYPYGLEFRVYETPEAAFGKDAVDAMQQAGAQRIGGAYYGNQGIIVLIASDLRSYEDAIATLRHEILAHHGLNLFHPADKRRIIERIKASRNERTLKKLWEEIDRDYPGATEDVKAEELFARIAEHKASKLGKLWNDLVQMIRDFLIRKGWITNKTTKGELAKLVESISDSIARGAQQQTIPETDQSTGIEQVQLNTVSNPMFYSQMHRILADKLPGKGSGASYLKTIKAYLDKGDFKRDEYEWSGIEEWLKSNALRKLTKSDVLDYINANNLKIEEIEKKLHTDSIRSRFERIKTELQAMDIVPAFGSGGYMTGFEGAVDIDFYENDTFGTPYLDTNARLNTGLVESILSDAGFEDSENIAKKMAELQDLSTQIQYEDEPGIAANEDNTQYADYVLPGGENYTELLITIPDIGEKPQWYIGYTDGPTLGSGYDTREAALAALKEEFAGREDLEVREGVGERRTSPVRYRSPHWNEPNVLAHVRYNERTDVDGKRVLFIEEIQSDWHQDGRKKGYEGLVDRPALRKRDEYIKKMQEKYGISDDDTFLSETRRAMTATEEDILNELNAELVEEGLPGPEVPNAPMKTTWPLLIIKRMIRHAAENGFDRIAWTTGEQQAARYNLEKHIDSIGYVKRGDNLYSITVWSKDAQVLNNQSADKDYLEENIGKELTAKILNGVGRQDGNIKYLEGLDLKVGGEGMRGFYDDMLPKMVNKYVKKWGSKVDQIKIGNTYHIAELMTDAEALMRGDIEPDDFNLRYNADVVTDVDVDDMGSPDNPNDVHAAANWLMEGLNSSGGTEVHSVDVTDKMRQNAMQGQPLFSRKGVQGAKTTKERRDHDRSFLEEFKYQPVDHVFRALFNLARIPKATKAAMNQLEKTVVERKFNPEGRFAFLNPWIETARAGLIDRYGLSEEFKLRDHQRETQKRAIQKEGFDFIKIMMDGGMSMDEAAVFKAMLEGEDIPESRWQALSQPIRESLDQMGHELVELGWLDAETYERNRGKWLHRVYLKHESDQSDLSRWVSKLMKKRRAKMYGDQLKRRGIDLYVSQQALLKAAPKEWWGRKITKKGDPQLVGKKFIVFDRVSNVGQGVGNLEGMEEGGSKPKILERHYWPADLPVPAKYQAWENKGEFEVRGFKNGKVDLWRDYTKAERERMGEILDVRYVLAKTYLLLANDLSTARFYRDIAEHPDWTWQHKDDPDPATVTNPKGAMATYNGYEWVKVPESTIPGTKKKTWGPLAGKYVRAEIYRDLHELQQMQQSNMWRKILTQWKLNKTARNPVVHMNNVMSNLMFMDLADIRMTDLVAAIHEMKAKGEHYQEAEAHGMFGATFIDQEIRDQVMNPILEELAKQNQNVSNDIGDSITRLGKITSTIVNGLMKADRKMIEAYQFEDELFRMATYLRKRAQGLTAEEAAIFGRDQFLNYDIRAPWINAMRRSVLPFIAYTYRAVPLIAHAIAERPWKIAKYATIAYGLNALAYALTSADEEKERKSLRREERGRTWLGVPRMLRMPFDDEHGNPVFLDIRRWIPAGDVFDTNQGQSPVPIPAPFQFSGPIMLAAELALNKQAFTGKEIVNRDTDTGLEQTAKVAGWAWRSWMPAAPYIPESWYWQKIERALRGGRDQLGREYGIGYALASSMGIKLKPHDVNLGYYYQKRDIDRKIGDLKFELRRAASDYNRNIIDKGEFERQQENIRRKLLRIKQLTEENFSKAGQ